MQDSTGISPNGSANAANFLANNASLSGLSSGENDHEVAESEPSDSLADASTSSTKLSNQKYQLPDDGPNQVLHDVKPTGSGGGSESSDFLIS